MCGELIQANKEGNLEHSSRIRQLQSWRAEEKSCRLRWSSEDIGWDRHYREDVNKMINFSTFAIIFKNVFHIFLKPVVRSVLKYRQSLVQFFKIRLACNYLSLQDGVKIFKNCIKYWVFSWILVLSLNIQYLDNPGGETTVQILQCQRNTVIHLQSHFLAIWQINLFSSSFGLYHLQEIFSSVLKVMLELFHWKESALLMEMSWMRNWGRVEEPGTF